MASDLISRDQLLGDLYAEWLLCTPDTPIFINGELQRCEKAKLIEEGMKLVQNQPTVDAVEVVHGEWMLHEDDFDSEYIECMLCGEIFYDGDNDTFDKPYNYCPNCGAKMDRGGNE